MPQHLEPLAAQAALSPTGGSVAVLSPADKAQALLPVRGARSQSLSKLPRRASTASVLHVPGSDSGSGSSSASAARARCADCDSDDGLSDQQQRSRHARRAMSAGYPLSLLQEELGYPTRQRKLSRPLDVPRRRASLLETALENTMARSQQDQPHSLGKTRQTSVNSSSTASLSSCDVSPEPESEEQQPHGHARSWTFNSGTCSPRSDARLASEGSQSGSEGGDLENFMDYRVASVTGYSRDADGVVYYEVMVRSVAHGPLSAYKVRRRYSEFRELHAALSRLMRVSSKRLSGVSALVFDGRSSVEKPPSSPESDNQTDEHHVGLRFSIGECDGGGRESQQEQERDEVCLPPLPDKGGVWSYLQFDSLPLLERRAAYFHAMLSAAQQHAGARQSRLVNDFVGTPPDLVTRHSSVENSYVSLNRFAAPKLAFSIEIQERKEKAKSIRRRRTSLRRQSFVGASPDAHEA